jgi:hypothetical protein
VALASFATYVLVTKSYLNLLIFSIKIFEIWKISLWLKT